MSREYSENELKELILRAKNGDGQSFSVVYEQFYTPIFRYFWGRTGDKELSEDLTQDVFLKGYKAIGNYTARKVSPLAFFYTIARNCLVDHWRRKLPERIEDELLNNIMDQKGKTDQLAIDRENEKILKRGLDVLTIEQREVLTLKYLNDFSTKEIAVVVEKSEEAIRQILVRALRVMKQELEKHGY